MALPSTTISQEEENGFRLHLLVGKCREALFKTFHTHFSSSPFTLYNQLRKVQASLLQLKNRKILTSVQWKLLFPNNCRTDSNSFDISLLYLLIQYTCNITTPQFWATTPAPLDYSPAANIIRIKKIRNDLVHRSLAISDVDFIKTWGELSNALLSLGYHSYNEITEVQTCALDLKVMKMVQAVEADFKKVENVNQQLQNDIKRLRNNLTGVWWKVLPNVQNFIGRDDEVKDLHIKIISADSTTCFGAVIRGMGGVGKTELAKYYCNKYGVSFYSGNVIWMEADDFSTLESSFFKVGEFLDLAVKDAYGNIVDVATVVTKVYNFFANRRSLFIFDNLTYFPNFIDFLPVSIPPDICGPTILATSQYKNWNSNFVMKELAVFSIGSTENFIKANLTDQNTDESNIKIISDLTGNLPLALQQAVSYIKRHYISISKYAELFQENFEEVFSSAEDDVFYKHTVLTTWKMALNILKEFHNQIAMDIMFLMAYMSGKYINKIILLGMEIQEVELNKVVDILALYSLISFSNVHHNVTITMHSLIQLVVKRTAPVDSPHRLLELLQKQINLSQRDKYEFGDIWFEHMICVFENCALSKDVLSMFLTLRIHLKQALINKGKYTICCDLFTKLLSQLNPHFDTFSLYAFYDLRTDIAKVKLYSGKYLEAKAMFQTILREQETVIQGRSRTHFETRNISVEHPFSRPADQPSSSGISKGYAKSEKDGIEENWQLVNYVKNRSGMLAQHTPLLLISNQRNLALCSLHQGNYNECSECLEKVKEFIVNFYGILHPSLNCIDHLLALCLLYRGKYSEALTLFKDVEENVTEDSVIEKKQSEQYDMMKQEGMLPEITTIRSCIAKCLYKLKKYKMSLEIFQEVESKRKELLGENHPMTLQDKCNTAVCIAQHFNFTKGIQILVEVEMKQTELFEGSNHPQLLITRYNVAKTLLKRGYVEDALQMYKRLYEKQCEIYDESHPKVRATQIDIEFCEAAKSCCCRLRNQLDIYPSFIEFN